MRYTKMIESKQEESREKVIKAIGQINQMLDNQERIVVRKLIKRTGFSKGFFYGNPEVREALDNARRQQEVIDGNVRQVIIDHSMEEKIIKLKITIQDLKKQNRELEKENQELKRRLMG